MDFFIVDAYKEEIQKSLNEFAATVSKSNNTKLLAVSNSDSFLGM